MTSLAVRNASTLQVAQLAHDHSGPPEGSRQARAEECVLERIDELDEDTVRRWAEFAAEHVTPEQIEALLFGLLLLGRRWESFRASPRYDLVGDPLSDIWMTADRHQAAFIEAEAARLLKENDPCNS